MDKQKAIDLTRGLFPGWEIRINNRWGRTVASISRDNKCLTWGGKFLSIATEEEITKHLKWIKEKKK